MPAAAASAQPPGPRAWLTTGDRASLLAEQPPRALGAPDPAAPAIAVDPTSAYQRIEGLGASITDSSAHLLAHSPDRDAIMRSLFDPDGGLGLSYLRQPIGASDFVAGPHYTYDDVAPGHTDFALRHFSIAHDRPEILPLLRQARALNPDLKVMATRYLTVGAIRNWAKTVITWNLALDPSGGPHNGGCGTCFGVVTVDPATGHATRTADYYVLGHVTRFVRPGAVRIASTIAGNAWNVACRNPDGSIVLVVVADDWGTTAQRFNVTGAGRSFSYELPAGAVATFVPA